MLPTVDFCGLPVTRLIIGANPFGGYSYQGAERDQEMRTYYTPKRIAETWDRAWAAGINTMIANNETPHVFQATADYLARGGSVHRGGPLQWIAQISSHGYPSFQAAIDRAVEIGCKAAYLHGGLVDGLYAAGDEQTLRAAIHHGQSLGIPMGVAGHATAVHEWVDSLDLVDFHAVCFFNCGNLNASRGGKFQLADIFPAVECIQRLRKPVIAYKIMATGRIDPLLAFEFAFAHIKPGDVVNVGMYRGDKNDMVEENAAHVRRILGEG